MRISEAVDEETYNKVDQSVWKETVERIREQGIELFEIHRNMYLEALKEGGTRDAEDAMTFHLDKPKRQTMTSERMQRLSLFRV
jgi:L-rhamnose mutarotase